MKEHNVDLSLQDNLNISNIGNDKKTQEIEQEDGEKVYPPKKVVLPAMAAIYLAVFLVALVSLHQHTSPCAKVCDSYTRLTLLPSRLKSTFPLKKGTKIFRRGMHPKRAKSISNLNGYYPVT